MAGVATMAGVAFVVHALVEHLQLDAAHTAAMWNHLNGGLREVTPGSRRTGTQR
jgi:hypothetical protein